MTLNKCVPDALMTYYGPLMAQIADYVGDGKTIDRILFDYKLGYIREHRAACLWRISRDDTPMGGCAVIYGDNGRVKYKKPFNMFYYYTEPCFFGEHLIYIYTLRDVAVVQHELTAMLASALYPDFVWLAVGEFQDLSQVLHRISDKRVFLFPDNKTWDIWSNNANLYGNKVNVVGTFRDIGSKQYLLRELGQRNGNQLSNEQDLSLNY